MKQIHNVIVKIEELFKWVKDSIFFTNLFLIDKLKSVKLGRTPRINNATKEPKKHFLNSPIKNIRLVNLVFSGRILDIEPFKVKSEIPLLDLKILPVELRTTKIVLANSIDALKLELKEDLNRRLANAVKENLKTK